MRIFGVHAVHRTEVLAPGHVWVVAVRGMDLHGFRDDLRDVFAVVEKDEGPIARTSRRVVDVAFDRNEQVELLTAERKRRCAPSRASTMPRGCSGTPDTADTHVILTLGPHTDSTALRLSSDVVASRIRNGRVGEAIATTKEETQGKEHERRGGVAEGKEVGRSGWEGVSANLHHSCWTHRPKLTPIAISMLVEAMGGLYLYPTQSTDLFLFLFTELLGGRPT